MERRTGLGEGGRGGKRKEHAIRQEKVAAVLGQDTLLGEVASVSLRVLHAVPAHMHTHTHTESELKTLF